MSLRLPGADRVRRPAALGGAGAPRGKLENGPGVPADLPGRWAGFRGTNREGISTEEVKPPAWGESGPRSLWKIAVGEGYAGAAIFDGRVYMLDFNTNRQSDVVRCLSLADGKDIWDYSYPVRIKRNHGMSRTVPAVTEKYVVTLGPKCHVTCLDSISGAVHWSMDLVREFNAKVPPWYAGQCPLIDNGRAILGPAGDKTLMVAVDCETGAKVWEAPNPRGWTMTHSSIMPVDFKGRRMYVYCGSGGVAGVAADDGTTLWDTDTWKISIATVPSPVNVGDGRIFFSGGYDAGCMMLQLREKERRFTAEVLWRLPAADFGATQQTPIWFEGHLYGIRPDGQLACLSPEGKVLWTSGAARRFGLGPLLIAGRDLYAMDDNGKLTVAEAESGSFRPIAEAKILSGPDAWGPMAIASGRLIARDLTTMVCLDVSGTVFPGFHPGL